MSRIRRLLAYLPWVADTVRSARAAYRGPSLDQMTNDRIAAEQRLRRYRR